VARLIPVSAEPGAAAASTASTVVSATSASATSASAAAAGAAAAPFRPKHGRVVSLQATGNFGFIELADVAAHNVFFHRNGLAPGVVMADLTTDAMVSFAIAIHPQTGKSVAVNVQPQSASASKAPQDGGRRTGRVVNPKSAFGFIVHDDFPDNIFFHKDGLASGVAMASLVEGALVCFATTVNPANGQIMATGVQLAASSRPSSHQSSPQFSAGNHSCAPPPHVSAMLERPRSATPPWTHDSGSSKQDDAWVRGTVHSDDESRHLEFKGVDASKGDVCAWMRDQLLPKLVNGFVNRRPMVRESLEGLILFGVEDDGRVTGMRADRATRDAIHRDLDTIVRSQVPLFGSAGLLGADDVKLRFVRVVQRDVRSGEIESLPDMWVGELRVRSCFDRCPVYSYSDASGAEVGFERWSGSMRRLHFADIGNRVQVWECSRRAQPSSVSTSSRGPAGALVQAAAP
jgi:cold shock CspA family protein